MKFTQMAAVIAGLTLAITSFKGYAETEVEGDFQDAIIQDSQVETKTINKKKPISRQKRCFGPTRTRIREKILVVTKTKQPR